MSSCPGEGMLPTEDSYFKNGKVNKQCPTVRVFQYRVGYWKKYRVAGRVGVLKNKIGYFRVSFLLSGISGYFRVIPGIPGD